MIDPTPEPGWPVPQSERQRAQVLFRQHQAHVHAHSDRVFAWLMAFQWVVGIAAALLLSPYGWEGKLRTTHAHVWYALVVGTCLSGPVIALTLRRPGWVVTRHAVGVAQILWSALLIHLSGGRIETHFHVFGSLAFLAFYRDWKVILTGTLVVAVEHLVRGLVWPESVYGVANPEWWRFLEHALWVGFEDVVLLMGIASSLKEMRALASRQAALEAANATVGQRVEQRTAELAASREQYRSLVETTHAIPWQWSRTERRFTYVGPQAGDLLGCPASEWLAPGFWEARVHPEEAAEVRLRWEEPREGDQEIEIEFRLKRDDGSWVSVRSIVSAAGAAGQAALIQGFMLDITERRRIEFELQQAQKLESVGRLASGVAHEINTPIQFVGDSVHFLRESVGDLFGVLDKQRALRSCVAAGGTQAELAARAAEAAAAEESADMDYLLENVPKAFERALDGLERVATIVRSMKVFAHPDQKVMAQVDINQAIESTLIIARNEYKYVADVETDLGTIPLVTCYGGDVNQALLNIVVNAAHAIGDVVAGTDRKGLIRVRTRCSAERVEIAISDSGGGIPEEIRARIFDPFFTTKPVGKGTGQGLAIARSVVVDKHHGEILVDSKVGVGTTFTIWLPVAGMTVRTLEAAA